MSFIKRMIRGYVTFLSLMILVCSIIAIFYYIDWEYIVVFVVVSLFAYDVGGDEKRRSNLKK